MAHKLAFTGKRAADEAVKVINEVKRLHKDLQGCFEDWERLQRGADDSRDPWLNVAHRSKVSEKKLLQMIERGTHDTNIIRDRQRVRDHVNELRTKLGSKLELLKELQKTALDEHRFEDGRPLPDVVNECVQQGSSDHLRIMNSNILKRARAHDSTKASTTEDLEVQKHEDWAGEAIKKLSEQVEEFEAQVDPLDDESSEREILALKIERHQWHIAHLETLRRRLHQRTLEFSDALSKTQQRVDEYVIDAQNFPADAFLREFYYDLEVYVCLGQPSEACEGESSPHPLDHKQAFTGEYLPVPENMQQSTVTSPSEQVPQERGRSATQSEISGWRQPSRIRCRLRSGSPVVSGTEVTGRRAKSIADTARRGREQEQVPLGDRLARSASRADRSLGCDQQGFHTQGALVLNSEGYPMRPGMATCSFYISKGWCLYRLKCRFHHPEPRENHQDCAGDTAMNTSRGPPSRQLQPALESLRFSQQETVETSVANASEGAHSSDDHSCKILNSRGYPLRPGAARCAFYMKTGWCLYRANCKYAHPEHGTLDLDRVHHGEKSSCPDSYETLKQRILQILSKVDKGIEAAQLMLELMKVEPNALQHMEKCGFKRLKPLLFSMPDVARIQQLGSSTRVTSASVQNDFPREHSEQCPSSEIALHESFKILEKLVAKVLLKYGMTQRIEVGTFKQFFANEAQDELHLMRACGFHEMTQLLANMPNVATMLDDGSQTWVSVKLNDSGLPLRPGQSQCSYYMKTGSCRYGATCKWHHPDSPAGGEAAYSTENPMQDSFEILQRCAVKVLSKYGSAQGVELGLFRKLFVNEEPDASHHMAVCGFSELKELLANMPNAAAIVNDASQLWVQVRLNESGLPLRPGQPVCSYYMKTGKCSYGAICKWHHPDGSSSGEADYYDEQSTQYSLEILERCIAKVLSKYGTAHGVELSGFMTLLLKEEPDAAHYMKVSGSTELKELLANVPNAATLCDDGSQAWVQVRLNDSGLPLRPGQPECSFYMKTGKCSYGAICRWHHPDSPTASEHHSKWTCAQSPAPLARRWDKTRSKNEQQSSRNLPRDLLPNQSGESHSRDELTFQIFSFCDFDQDGLLCAEELYSFVKVLNEEVDADMWAQTFDFLLFEAGADCGFDLPMFAKLLENPDSGLHCTDQMLEMALETFRKRKGQDLLNAVQVQNLMEIPVSRDTGRDILEALQCHQSHGSSRHQALPTPTTSATACSSRNESSRARQPVVEQELREGHHQQQRTESRDWLAENVQQVGHKQSPVELRISEGTYKSPVEAVIEQPQPTAPVISAPIADHKSSGQQPQGQQHQETTCRHVAVSELDSSSWPSLPSSHPAQQSRKPLLEVPLDRVQQTTAAKVQPSIEEQSKGPQTATSGPFGDISFTQPPAAKITLPASAQQSREPFPEVPSDLVQQTNTSKDQPSAVVHSKGLQKATPGPFGDLPSTQPPATKITMPPVQPSVSLSAKSQPVCPPPPFSPQEPLAARGPFEALEGIPPPPPSYPPPPPAKKTCSSNDALDASLAQDGSVMLRWITEAPESTGSPCDGYPCTLRILNVKDKSDNFLMTGPRLERSFVCGNGEVCDILESICVHMHIGEVVLAYCSASHIKTCPSCQCGVRVNDTNEVLGMVIELLDCQSIEETHATMPPEALIPFFGSRKDVANSLFKKDRVALALRTYKSVSETLKCYGQLLNTQELQANASELSKTCLLNIAACHLRLRDHGRVKEFCGLVLQLDPFNPKALYRRALAEFELQEFDDCMRDARKYLEHDSTSSAGQQLLQRAIAAQQDADKLSKPIFAKMFGESQQHKRADALTTVSPESAERGVTSPTSTGKHSRDHLPNLEDLQSPGASAASPHIEEANGNRIDSFQENACLSHSDDAAQTPCTKHGQADTMAHLYAGEQADRGASGKASSTCSLSVDDDCSEQSERSPSSNKLMHLLREVIGWKEQNLLSGAQFELIKERVLFKSSAVPNDFRQLIIWKKEGLLSSEQFEAAKDGLLAESFQWECRAIVQRTSDVQDSRSGAPIHKSSRCEDASISSELTDAAALLVSQLGSLPVDANLEEVESLIAAADAFKGPWGKLKNKKNKLLRALRKRQQELKDEVLRLKEISPHVLAGWSNLCGFATKLKDLCLDFDVTQASQALARTAFLDFQQALDILRACMTGDGSQQDVEIIQKRDEGQKVACQQVEQWHSSAREVSTSFMSIQPEFSCMLTLLQDHRLKSWLGYDSQESDSRMSELLLTACTELSRVDIRALHEGCNHVVDVGAICNEGAPESCNDIACLAFWICCAFSSEHSQDFNDVLKSMLQSLKFGLQLFIKALHQTQFLELELAEQLEEAERRRRALPSTTPEKALQDMSEAQQELRSLRRKLKDSKRQWEDAKEKLEDGDEGAAEEVALAEEVVQVSRQQVQKQEQALADVMSHLWQLQEAHFPELLPTLEEKVTSQLIKDALQTLKAADRTKVNAMFLTDRKVEYYDDLEEIGGRHEVFRGIYDSNACVIKKLPLTVQQGSKAFIRELRWLTKFSHAESSYTVPLRGFFVDGKCGYLHFDEYPSDLEAWICNHVGMEKLELLRIAYGVAMAVQYIHSVNFVHGDLKPKNVLMDCDAQPRLCDFEFGRELRGSMSTPTGVTTVPLIGWSEGFVAPELCQGSVRDPHKLATLESDMFSLGRTLLHMLDTAKSAGDFSALEDLIRLMLRDDLATRATAKDAVRHDAFSELLHKPHEPANANERMLSPPVNLSPPNYWSCQRLGVPFHIMPSSKYMKEQIERAFYHSDHCNKLSSVKVVGVKRVETQWVWLSYSAKRERMRDKLRLQGGAMPLKPPHPPPLSVIDEEVNEVFLWHGCPADAVHPIAKDGFDERLAYRKCLYGSGVYFTPQACKAMQYARASGCTYQTKRCGTFYCSCPGRKYLFYSRVCLGNPFYVQGPSRFLQRPPMQPDSPDMADSVVANPGIHIDAGKKQEHREIVIWNHAGMQAYAEFVVELEYPA